MCEEFQVCVCQKSFSDMFKDFFSWDCLSSINKFQFFLFSQSSFTNPILLIECSPTSLFRISCAYSVLASHEAPITDFFPFVVGLFSHKDIFLNLLSLIKLHVVFYLLNSILFWYSFFYFCFYELKLFITSLTLIHIFLFEF